MIALRTLVVRLVVASFSITALLGIVALLGGGDLGGVPGQVLLTTLVVGVESVAVLCYLAVAGTRRAGVGVLGGVASLVPFVIALVLVWGWWGDGGIPLRAFFVGLTLAASLAQACLLLGLAADPRGRVRTLLPITLALVALVALMIVGPILSESSPGGSYWRLFGVAAILDVLGTVLVIVLQRFSGSPPPATSPGPPADLLPPATAERLRAVAAERGTTPAALVEELLDGVRR